MGGASAGVTDNSLGQSVPAAQADGFLNTNVGGSLLFPGARVTHTLGYNAAFFAFIQRSQRLSLNQDLGWTMEATLTPAARLGFSAGVTQGRISDMNLFARQAPGGSVARPPGAEVFVGANAGQSFSWDFVPSWTYTESLGVNTFYPLTESSPRPRSLGIDAGISLGKRWTQDTASLGLTIGHGRTAESRVMGQVVWPRRFATYGEATLGWDHVFNQSWGMGLSAGVLAIYVPERDDPIIGPAGSVSGSYTTRNGGTARLSADRSVQTNVFLGDVFVQEGVNLTVAQTFGRFDAWTVALGANAQRARSVFTIMAQRGEFTTFAVDGTVAYDTGHIWRYVGSLNFAYQKFSAGSVVMNAPGMVNTGPMDFRRGVITVGIEGRYPPSRAAREKERERKRREEDRKREQEAAEAKY